MVNEGEKKKIQKQAPQANKDAQFRLGIIKMYDRLDQMHEKVRENSRRFSERQGKVVGEKAMKGGRRLRLETCFRHSSF